MEELIPLMVVSETEAEIALMNMEPSGTDYAPLPDHNAATDTPIGNTGSEDSTVIALETTSASRNYGSSSRNYCSVMNPIYESNPYLVMAPSFPPSSFSFKDSMLSVKNVFGKWGKKVAEKTKKAEDLAVNTWQHLKTGPSFTEVALERIAQTTKLIAEGGHEKIFRQTFETTPEELLQNSFACYFASSGGPVIGTLYASTKKLAYCSDNPLPYESSEHIEWIYYKVVIPLHLLKEVNPSVGVFNRSEKYIHLISMDGHEFWFTGFINYEGAVNCLKEALESSNSNVQFL